MPYYLIQFQKLKHVATRCFDNKFMEKSKQIIQQPGLFQQIHFFSKRKKRIGNYTTKLIFLWYDNFGKKERSLHRNGRTAIPKI